MPNGLVNYVSVQELLKLDDISGEKVGDKACGRVGDAGNGVDQPSLEVHAVQLGGLDQSIYAGGEMAALIGAAERPVLPVHGAPQIEPSAGLLSISSGPSSA